MTAMQQDPLTADDDSSSGNEFDFNPARNAAELGNAGQGGASVGESDGATGDVLAADRDGNGLGGRGEEAGRNVQSESTTAPQPGKSSNGDEEQDKPRAFHTYPRIMTQKKLYWDHLQADQLVWHDNFPALVVPQEQYRYVDKKALPPADETNWVMRYGPCRVEDRPKPDKRFVVLHYLPMVTDMRRGPELQHELLKRTKTEGVFPYNTPFSSKQREQGMGPRERWADPRERFSSLKKRKKDGKLIYKKLTEENWNTGMAWAQQFVDRALELVAKRKIDNEAHERDALEHAKREAEKVEAQRLARDKSGLEGEAAQGGKTKKETTAAPASVKLVAGLALRPGDKIFYWNPMSVAGKRSSRRQATITKIRTKAEARGLPRLKLDNRDVVLDHWVIQRFTRDEETGEFTNQLDPRGHKVEMHELFSGEVAGAEGPRKDAIFEEQLQELQKDFAEGRDFAKQNCDEGSVSDSSTSLTGTENTGKKREKKEKKKKNLAASGNGCDGCEGGSDLKSSHLAPEETERGTNDHGEGGVPQVAKKMNVSRQTVVCGTIDETVKKKAGRKASLEVRGEEEVEEKRNKRKSTDAAGADKEGEKRKKVKESTRLVLIEKGEEMGMAKGRKAGKKWCAVEPLSNMEEETDEEGRGKLMQRKSTSQKASATNAPASSNAAGTNGQRKAISTVQPAIPSSHSRTTQEHQNSSGKRHRVWKTSKENLEREDGAAEIAGSKECADARGSEHNGEKRGGVIPKKNAVKQDSKTISPQQRVPKRSPSATSSSAKKVPSKKASDICHRRGGSGFAGEDVEKTSDTPARAATNNVGNRSA